MENLNAETVKSELEGFAKFRTCPEYIKDALALITLQEQRIVDLETRLRHLFQSKTIVEYDEVDIHTKKYVKDIHSLDASIEYLAGECRVKFKRLTEENERLKNSITFQVVMPDEKMEEIKAECLERVALDVKECRADTVRKMQERLRKEAYPFPCAIGTEYAVPYCKIDQIAKEMLEEG